MTAGTEEDIQTAVPHGLTEYQWISAVLELVGMWCYLYPLKLATWEGPIVWAFRKFEKTNVNNSHPGKKSQKNPWCKAEARWHNSCSVTVGV